MAVFVTFTNHLVSRARFLNLRDHTKPIAINGCAGQIHVVIDMVVGIANRCNRNLLPILRNCEGSVLDSKISFTWRWFWNKVFSQFDLNHINSNIITWNRNDSLPMSKPYNNSFLGIYTNNIISFNYFPVAISLSKMLNLNLSIFGNVNWRCWFYLFYKLNIDNIARYF